MTRIRIGRKLPTHLYGFISRRLPTCLSTADHLYLVPYRNNGAYHGKLTRVRLDDFELSCVEWLDLAGKDPDLRGFAGGTATTERILERTRRK